MVRKNNAGFTKFADVIILETPTPLCHPLQTSELVDEVTCIVDAKHSLLPCIVFVYQKSEVRKKSYLQL